MKKKKIMIEQKDKSVEKSTNMKNLKSQSSQKKYVSNTTGNRKAISCQQIQNKSTRLVNDNLISTLHPKRTSVNLSSFIQVFKKKVRQTTIAKQFQNSLQKFDCLSSNRTMTIQRQKGGFVGSFKKQNQLMVENNRFDNKIKKIIISEVQYKDKKLNTRKKYSQDFIEKLAAKKQFLIQEHNGQKTSHRSRRRIFTYANTQNEDPQSHTISFYKSKCQNEEYGHNNPQNGNLDFNPNNEDGKHKSYNSNSNKSSLIFTNRRLETLNSYHRPNLMYNLSLYRKKNSYNVLRKSQKKLAESYKTKMQLQK